MIAHSDGKFAATASKPSSGDHGNGGSEKLERGLAMSFVSVEDTLSDTPLKPVETWKDAQTPHTGITPMLGDLNLGDGFCGESSPPSPAAPADTGARGSEDPASSAPAANKEERDSVYFRRLV